MPLVEIGGNKEKGLWETHAGYSTAATKTQYYSNEINNEISNLGTVVNNSTDGWKFTASQNVKVTAIQVISSSAGGAYFGWSLNATDITSSIESLTYANGKLLVEGNQSANGLVTIPITTLMKAGDVLRPQGGGSTIDNLLGYQNMNLVVEKDYSNTNMAHIIKPAVAYVKDIKAQNTAGGTFTSGDWRDRDLNTITGESWFINSLSSNIVTVQAGTYKFYAVAPCFVVDVNQLRLYDNTNSAVLAVGVSGRVGTSSSDNNSSFSSEVECVATFTSATAIKLQHRSTGTRSSDGFGTSCNFTNELYASMKIEKLK